MLDITKVIKIPGLRESIEVNVPLPISNNELVIWDYFYHQFFGKETHFKTMSSFPQKTTSGDSYVCVLDEVSEDDIIERLKPIIFLGLQIDKEKICNLNVENVRTGTYVVRVASEDALDTEIYDRNKADMKTGFSLNPEGITLKEFLLYFMMYIWKTGDLPGRVINGSVQKWNGVLGGFLWIMCTGTLIEHCLPMSALCGGLNPYKEEKFPKTGIQLAFPMLGGTIDWIIMRERKAYAH